MVREPVGQAFVFDQAVQAGLPVEAQVVVEQAKVARSSRHDRRLVASDAAVPDRDVGAAVDENGDPAGGIRITVGRGANELDAGEIERDSVSANGDQWRAGRVGRRQPVYTRSDGRGTRDR